MYYHPSIQRPERPQTLALTIYRRYRPGAVVEHRSLPGVALVIVSGPVEGLSGSRYIVQMPGGRREHVLEKNLEG